MGNHVWINLVEHDGHGTVHEVQILFSREIQTMWKTRPSPDRGAYSGFEPWEGRNLNSTSEESCPHVC